MGWVSGVRAAGGEPAMRRDRYASSVRETRLLPLWYQWHPAYRAGLYAHCDSTGWHWIWRSNASLAQIQCKPCGEWHAAYRAGLCARCDPTGSHWIWRSNASLAPIQCEPCVDPVQALRASYYSTGFRQRGIGARILTLGRMRSGDFVPFRASFGFFLGVGNGTKGRG